MHKQIETSKAKNCIIKNDYKAVFHPNHNSTIIFSFVFPVTKKKKKLGKK